MKILYDFCAYQAFSARGVGRYVYNMAESAIRLLGEPAYILLEKNGPYPEFTGAASRFVQYCFLEDFRQGKHVEKEFDAVIFGSSIRLDFNVAKAVTGPYPPEVLRCCKLVTCILHDFIPLFFRYVLPTQDRFDTYVLQHEALKAMDHIFVNSLFTKYSGVRYLERSPDDFTCLYGGADETKFLSPNSSRTYNSSERKNHIIYIGGNAEHKNCDGAVEAFCLAYQRGKLPSDAKLYITCAASEEFKERLRSITLKCGCKYPKQVEVTGFVSDAKLLELISTARSSFFPSFYEGLGLPILESYVAGTPCWASSVTATKEFVLPECSFDPFSKDEMVAAIEDIYTKEELCRRSLEYGRGLIQVMNWDAGAAKMLQKLHELLAEKSC